MQFAIASKGLIFQKSKTGGYAYLSTNLVLNGFALKNVCILAFSVAQSQLPANIRFTVKGMRTNRMLLVRARQSLAFASRCMICLPRSLSNLIKLESHRRRAALTANLHVQSA